MTPPLPHEDLDAVVSGTRDLRMDESDLHIAPDDQDSNKTATCHAYDSQVLFNGHCSQGETRCLRDTICAAG